MFTSTAIFHSPPAGKDKWNYSSITRKSDPSVSISNTRGFKRLDSLDSDCHSSRSSSYDSSVASKMNNSEKVVDQKIPANSSSKESKWFGFYPQSDHQSVETSSTSSASSNQKSSGKNQNHYTAVAAPSSSRPSLFYQPQVHLFNHHHSHHHQPHQQPSWNYYQQHQAPPPSTSYQVPYNLTKGHFEVWQMEHMMQQGCYLQQPSMPFNQSHQEWGQGSSITRCVNYIYEGASNLISAMSTSLSFSTTLSGGQAPKVLNPNAKSFTPLNPNAKEFHPTSSSPTPVISDPVPKERENSNSNNSLSNEKDESSVTITPPNGLLHVEEQENGLQITPEIKCEMKSIAYRKCTPWIPKISVKSKDQEKPQQENRLSDISFSEDDHEVLEDSDDVDDDDDDDDDAEDEDDGSVSKRTRLLSQCSSESGSFIQFGSEESPKCTKSSPRIPEKPSPFLANFLCGHEDDDDEEEESSEDEDSDHFGSWDSSIDAIVLDDPDILAEFGLQCQWQIPSQIGKSVDTVDHQNIAEFEEDLTDQENSDCLLLDEFHLSRNAKNDHNEILKQIQDANERWSSFNNGSENCKQTAEHSDDIESIIEEERKTKVTFTEPLVTHVTYVIPIIRKADLGRFERLLKPIFGTEHRQKMRSYIADNCF